MYAATLRWKSESLMAIEDDVIRAANDENVDSRLLVAMAWRESGMDPFVIGNDGELGLLQIMPATWEEWASVGDQWDVPYDNANVAARYLRSLWLRTGESSAAAVVAYNWGITRLEASAWPQVSLACVAPAAVADYAWEVGFPLGTCDPGTDPAPPGPGPGPTPPGQTAPMPVGTKVAIGLGIAAGGLFLWTLADDRR